MNKEKTTIRRKRQQQQPPAGASGRMKLASLMFICLMVVASLFFVAARQHFSSVDYGMRNSKLRKQLDDLEAEKRRLLLAREVTLSPAEIKKAVKKLGISDLETNGVEMAAFNPASSAKASQSSFTAKASAPGTGYVAKTASIASISRPRTVGSPKSEERSKSIKTASQISKLVASR